MGVLVSLVLFQIALPFELPADFDSDDYLLPSTTDAGSLNSPRGAAALAEGLVDHGAPESLALAEQVLKAVLDAQETRAGAAHRGNFEWRFGDGAISDLNSVEFTLRHVICTTTAHRERLPGELRGRVLEAVRLGLEEIARMNVAITYTNVATMDCMNTVLGGELLGDAAFIERGRNRLKELERETLSHGTFCEFNTPTYTRVTHDALTRIARYTTGEETAIRARALRSRLALTAVLHVHPETGRWAGPHGRGHSLSRPADIEPERQYLERWAEMGNAPAYMLQMLDGRPLPYQAWESVYEERRLGAMTYLDRAFAMGTAVREISRQTDVFLIHCTRRDGAPPALVYSKYLIDDEEDAAPRRLLEQGQFYGVQWGARAIGLYAPRCFEHPTSLAPPTANRFQSAKAVVEFAGRGDGHAVWVGEQLVESFPRTLEEGEVAVVECGEALVAIRPLSRDDLGNGAPLRIVQRRDRLALEMFNYLGPETVFWEMDRDSRFFQGKPRCGFYAEAAAASDFADGAAFARAVASGTFRDAAEPPVTSYHDGKKRIWAIEYARGGKRLGIEIDLIGWTLERRWNEEGDLGWPLLESPLARQSASGRVEAGDATMTCGNHPAWLFSLPEKGTYLAGYHGPPAPFCLKTPETTVTLDAMGTGTVALCGGEVVVDALHTGEPRIEHACGNRRVDFSLADGTYEVHGPLPQPDPVWPVDFQAPVEATCDGVLDLEWQLVEGRGCQVAEVWLIPN